MTIRSDLTIDWEVSPRIITVASGSNTISIQDLIDTCMYECALPANMDDDILLESSGKEYLVADGSVKVGLTVTLNNAQIAFEARPGPDWVLCIIDGGNVVAVEDIYAQPRVYFDPRKPTAYVSVDRTASSSATLQEIDEIIYKELIADAVWDEEMSSHTVSGTVGKVIYDVDSKLPAGDIAESGEYTTILSGIEADVTDIHNKLPAGTIASEGEYDSDLSEIKTKLERVLGLSQENYALDNTSYITYNSVKLLTAGRLRIYSDSGSVGTDSDVVATYNVVSDWTNDELNSYKVTKI